MKISPARTAAFDVLLRIETEASFSSVLLPEFENALDSLDRSLCHEITLGTLRHKLYLDAVIAKFAGPKKIDIEVRTALRIGLYQHLFLTSIPAYSVINESVNLVERARKKSAKGFVNAILRKATRESVSLLFTDEIEQLSIETSHPRWLVERWIAQFGFDMAKQFAAKNNEKPQLAFRFLGEESQLDRDLADSYRPSSRVDGCYLATSDLNRFFELAVEGAIYIQDEASQMTANAVDIPAGGRFLDVCAAPGGKTGSIAKRQVENFKLLAAGDLHWRRAEYLRANCERQGANSVAVLQFDAELALPFYDKSFETVLVDAPCSGTGTIRHNPEIRYSVEEKDFHDLASKQLRILKIASKVVSDGGTLLYSTCSVDRVENEDVCRIFLESEPNFDVVAPDVPKEFMTDDGFARTWPFRDEMDGFFIAAFKRRSVTK